MPRSKSLREYAEFELERKGYDRAQVDAFLAELDQAFLELEASVRDRGDEVGELQKEVERLKRESPVGRSEELLRRAELNAEQMLASSLSEAQEIISNAETMAMKIIAKARAQSREIASQPPGFGMLARVRTIAADIDRIKAEHAALMEEEPGLLEVEDQPIEDPTQVPTVAEHEGESETAELAVAAREGSAVEAMEADEVEELAEETVHADEEDERSADDGKAQEPAPGGKALRHRVAEYRPALGASTTDEPPTEDSDPLEEVAVPRIQLVEPPPKSRAPEAEEVVDTKNFDWSAARDQVLSALDDDAIDEDLDDDDDDEAPEGLPTIMRREGSRYERHSASLPKIGTGGESTLSEVSKVSRRRRRRTPTRDDDTA